MPGGRATCHKWQQWSPSAATQQKTETYTLATTLSSQWATNSDGFHQLNYVYEYTAQWVTVNWEDMTVIKFINLVFGSVSYDKVQHTRNHAYAVTSQAQNNYARLM